MFPGPGSGAPPPWPAIIIIHPSILSVLAPICYLHATYSDIYNRTPLCQRPSHQAYTPQYSPDTSIAVIQVLSLTHTYTHTPSRDCNLSLSLSPHPSTDHDKRASFGRFLFFGKWQTRPTARAPPPPPPRCRRSLFPE